jgi:CHAT domain-containing protein
VEYTLIPEDSFKFRGNQRGKASDLFIWVVQPNGNIIYRKVPLPPQTPLAELVDTSREEIGVRGRGNFEIEIANTDPSDRLKQLHQLLIAPIADLLPTDPNAQVVFVPHGELFLVPFPALQDAKGQYLIEQHTILTTPAIQVLDLTRQKRQQVTQAGLKDVVIVGNPTMPQLTKLGEAPEQLQALPGAEREANRIADLFKTKAWVGSQATKAAIVPRLSQARIIHLATHGLLDDLKGLGTPGAIALAPSGTGEPNDGLLTANEILDLKLNAELVVLSACDTGRGKITSDSVIGLSRSLILAGTSSVMVSLWSVPDAPTAELMAEFYQNWEERKMDKAQALRQAMLTIMKRPGATPRDWAAFTLIGESK